MRQERKYGSNWGCCYFLFERKSVNVLSNVMYSDSHRRAGATTINIKSALRNAPDLCKNVSLAVPYHLVATVAHIKSQRSQVCVYTNMLLTIYRRKLVKRQNNGAAVHAACQGNISACQWFGGPVLRI